MPPVVATGLALGVLPGDLPDLDELHAHRAHPPQRRAPLRLRHDTAGEHEAWRPGPPLHTLLPPDAELSAPPVLEASLRGTLSRWFLLGTGAVLALGAVAFFRASEEPRPAPSLRPYLVCLLPFLGLAVLNAAGDRYRVTTAPDGVRVRGMFRERLVAWAEIRGIAGWSRDWFVNRAYSRTTVTIQLRLAEGSAVRIRGHDLERDGPFASVMAGLFEFLTLRLLRRDLQEFDERGAIALGDVEISREGIRCPARWLPLTTRLFPWKAVRRLILGKSRLEIFTTGRLFADASIGLAEQANLFTLMHILPRLHPVTQA